ncbi:phosphopantetheine-binding protein [Sphaerisporangium sp. TRM90804]|uniref:phosphopantetheine-binding protein n=1 Tax=Sphaerisporangium sp. TRM90804 TaxID=3031113 RepID=UPI0024482AA8|nr:phosphopantetheine-binding protein [Sphaerisporangium sp. TRM90804]MDH2427297.1 phosphopantetheine-binding protein [Sphaerisporangium sp. TRM90804]
MPVIDRARINAAITAYVSVQFLDESELSELEQETPLLDWGVLNSMNTSMLLAYIRKEFGVTVPPAHITWRHFQSLKSITELVHDLSAQQTA